MFSEALRIMDRNTTKYMIDELNQALADKDHALADLSSEIASTLLNLIILTVLSRSEHDNFPKPPAVVMFWGVISCY